MDVNLVMEERAILEKYKILCDMAMLEMRQRAEEEWVIMEDRCSIMFHQILKAKINRSAISKVIDKE